MKEHISAFILRDSAPCLFFLSLFFESGDDIESVWDSNASHELEQLKTGPKSFFFFCDLKFNVLEFCISIQDNVGFVVLKMCTTLASLSVINHWLRWFLPVLYSVDNCQAGG